MNKIFKLTSLPKGLQKKVCDSTINDYRFYSRKSEAVKDAMELSKTSGLEIMVASYNDNDPDGYAANSKIIYIKAE